ncbi:SIMPL domain-containing protein [Nocardioides euryhalodurans]|uniref:DUF541 domain-containing protein n=1 Tax=Nocardioides euryhalodurans TaxID=2518370 RepID=A0A4P7GHP3_9ACTN|nr:SIMPL domain-containing protein [Nocardioides euryhalodurans]QBR91366.1 DUF541 domain-containing protein [Nocardioides euryhalodurans]
MERTVTVSVRGLLVAGVALLALVTAYLLGGAGGAPPAPAQASTAAPQPAVEGDARTLRMVGSGEATVVPDQLTFALSVTDQEVALDQALADSSDTMKRVLAALEPHGVRAADVQTTALQMYPEYDYPSYGPPVLTGYRVTQRARVTVRDLAAGGRAVSAAVETGGNGVRASDIRLGVSDPQAGLARARDAAVAAATAKAEQYAAATGQSLGDVLGLRELGGDRPVRSRDVAYRAQAAELDALATLPVRAGKEDLTVRVEVLWAFE